ncbi:hypothetical protein BBO99_00007714 [Phytophthora kernoviae]|uniref:Uncharacterized protein n=1 Tax=Phytophthora kernoviae TaxID=325452 RepID=A0A3R7HEW4_9STRA|nr:hypothetical protein BBI17_009409 [Phytophthora kernoviae]RLN76245.1 hypothetical protein BBO99_00007714 [Phytophthora kernoviae]
MEIQLNATEDEEEAPVRLSAVSHTVPMSSLLSSDVSTPRSDVNMAESPPPTSRTGLSSLMNSPIEYRDSIEDIVDASQGSEAAVDTVEDDVDMDEPMKQSETLPELQDAELEALKTELQMALQRQYTDAPGPKRHKKGKQTRRGRSSGSAAAEVQVQSCVAALQRKVSSQFGKKNVLEDAVSFSLAFCGLYDEKEAVRMLLVRSADDKKVDVRATLDKLSTKPLYGQLVGVIRRAVLSSGEVKSRELLTKVWDWCLAREETANWTWMLAVIAQMNSYCVQEFLFREAIARYQLDGQEGGDQVVYFLPVLEFLAAKHPDETMEPQIDENISREDARQRFDEWKQWLCLLAQSISRKEVTDQLIKAELMLAEFNELPFAVPPTAIQPADRALCELLTALLAPPSPDYVAFYRAELVQQRERETLSELNLSKGDDLQSRLQSLKMNLFRVLALDGGVAHYASSVYSVFVSLWLDALLSTTSATSIPTHFPNGVNFADLNSDDSGNMMDDREAIRCERTISSKCTNLQSSQVITRVPETKLVYRKTLDSSWEREMHAARICSVYATDLFTQLLASTGTAASLLADPLAKSKPSSSIDDDEQCERRLKIVVGMLLERVIPCCGVPSDDVYKDTLPNRSSFDVDLRVEQWLNHFPAFLPLLHVVITTSTALGSSQVLRLVPVFKSALIVLLGHWNSVKGELAVKNGDVPPYMRNQNQLALTCELMRLLRATNWLPVPLGKAAELLPLTTPADIRSILFSCWFYLSDHPPRSGSRAPTPATSATASPISSGSSPAGFSISGISTGGPTSSSSHPPVEFYLIPLRKALHRNIAKVGAKYPHFMC